MSGIPFKAYKGNDPFVFVSYAHKDSALVFPELSRLKKMGFNVWYDEGIDPGTDWPKPIADAILDCSIFVLFVSSRSVASVHCRNEVYFAFENKKPFLSIHLAKTDTARIDSGLALTINAKQAILKYDLDESRYEEMLRRGLVPLVPGSRFTDGPKPSFPWKVSAAVASIAISVFIGVEHFSNREQMTTLVYEPSPPTESPARHIPSMAPKVSVQGEEPNLTPVEQKAEPTRAPSLAVVPTVAPTKAPAIAMPTREPTEAPAPTNPPTLASTPNETGFKAGEYASGQQGNISVSGPFPADDNRQIWIYTGSYAGGTWTTGPAKGHPQLTAFPADTFYPVGWSYGLDASGNLICVRQLGDQLVIMSPQKNSDKWNRIHFDENGSTHKIFDKVP